MNISLSGFPAYIAIILFLLMIAFIPMYLLSKVRRKSYEFARQYDTIVKTEYEPPYGLTPAELGYIVDAKFSKREFYATILDLEQRGFIEINKSSRNSFTISALDVKINKLRAHERVVVKRFINMNSLSRENRKSLKKFKKAVISSLVRKGLVKPSAEKTSFLAGRIIFIFLITNVLLTLLFLFADGDDGLSDKVFFLFLSPLLFTPITLPISVILGYVYHNVVGETGLWTKNMRQAWVEISGYSHFVEQVELDNIQFESSDLKSKTKIKAFPYAVALGMDTQWEDRFRSK